MSTAVDERALHIQRAKLAEVAERHDGESFSVYSDLVPFFMVNFGNTWLD